MPTQLIDKTTGQPVDVPDDQVQEFYQTGRYGFPKGQRIGVVGRNGKPLTIDPTEASKAFRSGYRFQGAEEQQSILDEREYGGVEGGVVAGAEGAVRGATMGLSDPAAIAAAELLGGEKAGEKVRTHLRKYKETNPTASLAGELGGAVAPILLSGGTAAPIEGAALAAEGARAARGAVALSEGAQAARGAASVVEGTGAAVRGASALSRVGEAGSGAVRAVGAPTRAVARAGDLVEKGVAAVLGESSPSAFARVAKSALARGAGDAVQGALMGAGQQVSEDALGNHELAADKMLASIGHGALFAGLLGAGFAGGGEAIRVGIEKSSPLLKRMSEIQAVRALSAGTGLESKRFMQAAEHIPGGVEGVGEELLKSKLVRLGDTVHDIAPRVRAAAEEAGARRGALIRELDAAGIEAPKLESIEKKFRAWLDKEHGTFRHTEAGAFRAGETLLEDLRSQPKVTYESLFDWRRKLDDKINWARKNPWSPENATADLKKALRNIVEDEIKYVGDAGAKRLGKEFLEKYQDAGLRYRRLVTAADMAEDAVTRLNKNQMFGMGEKILAGAAFGGSLASDEGDGHGGAILSGLKGLAAAVAMKQLRTRGNATAAVFMDKVAALSSLRLLITRTDQRISTDVDRFFENKPSKELPLKTASKEERDRSFDRAIKVTRAAAADAHGVVDAVERHTGPISAHAPRIAHAFGMGAARAATFLASKMPEQRQPVTIQPQMVKAKPADVPTEQKEKFLRFVRAINDPMSVLSDMTRGRLTPEAVEAVKVVYPALYDQIRAKVIDRATDQDAKPLSMDQKILVARLFGVVTDDTLQPDFIQRMQANYQQKGGDKESAPAPSPRGSPRALSGIEQTTKLNGFGGGRT